MTNKEKKEFLENARQIEVGNAYCNHCTKCNVCYQEGQYGSFELKKEDCRKGLQYADKKQLKKDLAAAYNYIPGNFQM